MFKHLSISPHAHVFWVFLLSQPALDLFVVLPSTVIPINARPFWRPLHSQHIFSLSFLLCTVST